MVAVTCYLYLAKPRPCHYPFHRALRNKHNEKSEGRKRGRPAGHNRTPLTKDEKRARNAQYERERRQEHASATIELGRQVGCDASASQTEVMVAAITFLRPYSKRAEEITELIWLNKKLMDQIAEAESRLAKMANEREEESDESPKPEAQFSQAGPLSADVSQVVMPTQDISQPGCSHSQAPDGDVAQDTLGDHGEVPDIMSIDFGDLFSNEDINNVSEWSKQLDFPGHLS
ncbi:hypothetical protein ACJJTC_016653 [Scirpophaga incertulas]